MNGEPFDGNNHFTPEQIAQDDILRFFKYGHLPVHLQVRSKPWADLARHVVESVPPGPERTVALRKLLEGKDAAVRAALPK